MFMVVITVLYKIGMFKVSICTFKSLKRNSHVLVLLWLYIDT